MVFILFEEFFEVWKLAVGPHPPVVLAEECADD
jgi:hypothetical protein